MWRTGALSTLSDGWLNQPPKANIRMASTTAKHRGSQADQRREEGRWPSSRGVLKASPAPGSRVSGD